MLVYNSFSTGSLASRILVDCYKSYGGTSFSLFEPGFSSRLYLIVRRLVLTPVIRIMNGSGHSGICSGELSLRSARIKTVV
jgi:hypothetical protein